MIKKFSKFRVTIHPKLDEKELTQGSWSGMSKELITERLRKLKFKTPIEMARICLSISLKGDKKRNSDDYYVASVKDFGGQLELGTKNGIPHYQLWVELKPQTTKKRLLNYLSQVMYNEEISDAISVEVLTEDIEAYKDYCSKEDAANLLDEYAHIKVDKTISEFDEYLEVNPETKKYWIIHTRTRVG